MRARRARSARASGLLVAAVATFSLALSGTANAVISGTTDAVNFANNVAAGVAPTGGTFAVNYPCVADDTNTPDDETNCPTGVSDTPLAGFPTDGPSYGVMSTGNVAFADDPNNESGISEDWLVDGTSIGEDVHDYQIARIDLPAATTSCLAFDFKFLSDEYPEYVDKGYNDAFIAQLNNWAVSIAPGTQTINAPGNFAGGAGDTISVDSGGPSAMTAPPAVGTTYDGATPILTARIPVTPGTTNTVFLTLFDQGDGIYDSAVFVDNLRYESIDATKCKSLSNDPYDGTTGVSPVAGTTATLTTGFTALNVPLSCNLPPGAFTCDVNGAASFTATAGRTVARGERGDRAAAVLPVALAAGSASIPASTNGTLSMATTPAGVAAVKAAIAKPALLKAQAKVLKHKAKKLLRKAKQLREEGKIAKAKKLEKKAAKLIKRAKALIKRANILLTKPLGMITITITNPKNGTSASFTSVLPRP